jgi:hypothetical protein
VERGLVPELRERVDDLFLHFLLVERTDERRLAVATRIVFVGFPPIV